MPTGKQPVVWTEHSPSLICPSSLRVASPPFRAVPAFMEPTVQGKDGNQKTTKCTEAKNMTKPINDGVP